jgi:hypothetical protein
MPVLLKRFANGYCDVAAVPAGILFAHTEAGAVKVSLLSPKLEPLWTVSATSPESLMFLRLAALDDKRFCVVGKGNKTGHAYIWNGKQWEDLGGTFGNYPLLVRPNGESFEIVWQIGVAHAKRRAGSVSLLAIKQTSQGFAGWRSGQPVLRDTEYSLKFKDSDGVTRTLGEVQRYTASLIVGQWSEPGKVGIAGDYLGDIFTIIPGDSFEPYVVTVAGGFAVASRTSQGATVAFVTLPLPKHEPKAGTVPTPPPQPEPEPESVPAPKTRIDVVKRNRQKYDKEPKGNRRAFLITNATAWDLRSEGAGLFAKPSGNNYNRYSTDCIIFKSGYMLDVLGDGEGDADPQWNFTGPDGASGKADVSKWRNPLDPAIFEPEPTPTPQPTPTPEPEPPASINVKSELTAIRDRINVLLGQL